MDPKLDFTSVKYEFRASDRATCALRSSSLSKTSCLAPEGSIFDKEQLLFGKGPNYKVSEQQLQPYSPGVFALHVGRKAGLPCTWSECVQLCCCTSTNGGYQQIFTVTEGKTLIFSILPCSEAFIISLQLTLGSMNYSKWLQCFWHSKRASVLSAETCHIQENYPKPKKT